MTRTIYLQASQDDQLETAAQMLRDGKLVAFPTETVYGLGGLAFSEEIVERIFAAKNRPSNNPLILHVESIDAARALFNFEDSDSKTLFINRFDLLSKHFWPGPLTLVGKKTQFISSRVTAGSPKVAVRFPACPIARRILELVGQPIAAPSANLFTRPSPTVYQHVISSLDSRIDAVVDGGSTEYGIESTVVDIDGEFPKILRLGAISFDDLIKLLPDLISNPVGAQKEVQDASPGLSAKHYSPAVAYVSLADNAQMAKAWFSSSGIILRQKTQADLSRRLGERPAAAGPSRTLPDDAKGCARELFSAFYEMESQKPKSLLIEDLLSTAPSSEWDALRDRLVRACSKD
jgi:L-threonylcarbamoyladenylate synthase